MFVTKRTDFVDFGNWPHSYRKLLEEKGQAIFVNEATK